MTTSLVIGGAGFIGSHIVDALLARGDQVRVFDNLSSGNPKNLTAVIDQIDFVEGNILDEAAVVKAMTGVDFVFHLAAMVSVPESMKQPVEAELINTVGTLNVLQAAQRAKVKRLVLSSTCAVYGDEPTLPKTELMAPQPQSPYAISKLAAESYCNLFTQSFSLETVVLRYFNVFGPRQDPSSVYSGVISIFVDKMMHGLPLFIFGDGQQTRDFVFVKDIVRANLLAAETPAAVGQVFGIGTGRAVTINQLFESLQKILEQEIEPIYKPERSGDIRYSYCDPTLANKVLGWEAQVSLEHGLSALVESIDPEPHTPPQK
ncbi:MAG: SDR family oxidoreductase [Chloroflexota bacterium]